MDWNADPVTKGLSPNCNHLLHVAPIGGPIIQLTCVSCHGSVSAPMSLREGETTWDDAINRVARHVNSVVCDCGESHAWA